MAKTKAKEKEVVEKVVIEEVEETNSNEESDSKLKSITEKVVSTLSSAADFAAEGSSLLIDNISYKVTKAKIKILSSKIERDQKNSLEEEPFDDEVEVVKVKDEDVVEVTDDIVVVPKFDKLKEEGKKTTATSKKQQLRK